MGYKVKWVEDNLGVSRKALRNFEKLGLMPANGGGYRDYSDEDIERIWKIRLLQGMGYSLKEIIDLEGSDAFEFEISLEKKIKELESRKANIERHLGYAQAIKLTGRFPAIPKDMGSVTFEEFYEKSLNEWNVSATPELKASKEIVDLLNRPEDEWQDNDISFLLEFFTSYKNQLLNMDALFVEKIIPTEILKRKERGPADDEVQLLVKILYESRICNFPDYANLTRNQFVRFEASSYVFGDVSQIHKQEYGKEGCLFIADAIAVFGGFSCYDEVED